MGFQRIKAGRRHRKDFGDLKSLAQSIKEEGLLQPVHGSELRTVNPPSNSRFDDDI
jgi:ParB-like chromosome segregation protein Spo0J